MADTTLILGIVGVAGTVGGATAGAFIGARTTKTVEERRHERIEREQAAQLRAAARLIWIDLAQVDGNLDWAALRSRWDPALVGLPIDAWEEHRSQLALGVADPDQWKVIAEAVSALMHFRRTTAVKWSQPLDLEAEDVANIKAMRLLVLRAATAISPLAGMPPPMANKDHNAGPYGVDTA